MNVVYRGIENPITIAVSNVKSFKIYGKDVKQKEDGNYVILPSVGIETKVFVEITNFDNSITIEEHIYRIKSLPSPIGTINDEYATKGILEFQIEELKDAIIGIKFVDFAFNYRIIVSQFSIKVPGYPTLVIDENSITDEAFELIKKVKKKDTIVISEIKGKYFGYDGFIRYPRPLTFKIIK